uniref:G-protein coupled receptors family 1 profile domain-containing protein n=1 Tax=Cavia porcellus TaxID=10141 RepID=A0A286XWC2_CAVPO
MSSHERMTGRNDSFVTEFILEGLTDSPDLQLTLFSIFLGIYVVTVVAKLSLITLISLNAHLHTPMCYFHFNLSFFFCFLVSTDCYTLTAMPYDCCVAICKPLLYSVILSPQVCSPSVFGMYVIGCFDFRVQTLCMVRLTFFGANTINHYLCDTFPMPQLSCTGTYDNEFVVFVLVGLNTLVSTSTIFISYGFTISSIPHVSSMQGRIKAFNTCSSQLVTVSLFFGAASFMYLQSSDIDPLIYSLRNKDVKLSLKMTLRRKVFF